MKQSEVLEMLERLESVFGSVTKNENGIHVWCELLRKYPTEQVMKACDDVLETNHYTPKPADIIEAIKRQPKQATNLLPTSPVEHKGMVKTDTGWDFPENCINHNGEWKKKIEFVCDVLGDDNVTAMLKEELQTNIVGFNFSPKKYTKFLNEVLVPMAQGDVSSGWY